VRVAVLLDRPAHKLIAFQQQQTPLFCADNLGGSIHNADHQFVHAHQRRDAFADLVEGV
jgi:hypothetical protein